MAANTKYINRVAQLESLRPAIEAFGPAVVARIVGEEYDPFRKAVQRIGIKYKGDRIARLPEAAMVARVQQAKDWIAAGSDPKKVPPLDIQHKDAGKFNRTLKICQPAGVAPNVSILDLGFKAGASVDVSRAKVTIAPPFVDRRFAPDVNDPDYRPMFTITKPGRDPMTGEAWA